MVLPKVSGTKIRGGTYHLNLPIPTALRAQMGGKAVVEGTLKTADPKEAERHVRARRVELEARLAQVRLSADQARLVAALDPADRTMLADLGGIGGILRELRDLRAQAAFIAAAAPSRAEVAPLAEIEALTREERLAEDRARAASAAELGVVLAEARTVRRVAEALGEPVPPAPSWSGEAASGMRELASRFAKAKSWTVQNTTALTYTVRRWEEFHGDVALERITRGMIGDWAQALTRFPRDRVTARATMREAVAAAERAGLPAISEKTRVRMVDHVKAMLAWAHNQGMIPADPGAGYRLDKPKVKAAARKVSARRAFTPDQVRAILDHVAATADKRTLDWWMPALAAFAGARREELGQLRLADVGLIDGVFCLTITDEGEGQKVKNSHSLRTLPVPQPVLDLGFADYVMARREAGGVMLWQELHHDKRKRATLREVHPDPRGRYTEGFGNRFTRKVRAPLGFALRGHDFHSLRHSWTLAARKAGIDP